MKYIRRLLNPWECIVQGVKVLILNNFTFLCSFQDGTSVEMRTVFTDHLLLLGMMLSRDLKLPISRYRGFFKYLIWSRHKIFFKYVLLAMVSMGYNLRYNGTIFYKTKVLEIWNMQNWNCFKVLKRAKVWKCQQCINVKEPNKKICNAMCKTLLQVTMYIMLWRKEAILCQHHCTGISKSMTW